LALMLKGSCTLQGDEGLSSTCMIFVLSFRHLGGRTTHPASIKLQGIRRRRRFLLCFSGNCGAKFAKM
jgi:hypothetical protein